MSYNITNENYVCVLYKRGLTLKELALIYKCSDTHIHRILKRNGVICRPSYIAKRNNIEKFWDNIQIGPIDYCWLWTKSTRKGGYGHVKWEGKDCCAHRLSYQFWYKCDIPSNLEVCHKCDNPKCCNPTHLFLGTTLDNVRDKVTKNRQARGTTNGKSKLTEDDVTKIKFLYKTKAITYTELGQMFCVSKSAIAHIIRGESWNWL